MIRVLKPGLWTSVQDQGRFGFKHFGVPSSGCMDQYSAELANRLLNNSPDAAVLEFSLLGPVLEFQMTTHICICGADLSPELNMTRVTNNTPLVIKSGDVLKFGHLNYGAHGYVAVKGGVQTDIEMDSRSFYQGISAQQRLEKGDLLDYQEVSSTNLIPKAHVKVNTLHFEQKEIECFPGPEFSLLNEQQQNSLLGKTFTLSKEYSRMGIQLNELVFEFSRTILSSAVIPGTVQLTPSGKLIVLMRDCQTTGGYPRILQLSEDAINRLAQKKPGDQIQFKLLSV